MSLCFLEGPEAGTGNWRGMDPKNCRLLWFCTWWSWWWWWGGETSLVCFGGDLVNMFVVLVPLQQLTKKIRTPRIKIVFASRLVLDLQFREYIWWIKDWSRLEKMKTRAREGKKIVRRIFEWKYLIFKRVFLLLMGDGMKKRRLWIVDSKIYGHIKRERERECDWKMLTYGSICMLFICLWFYSYVWFLCRTPIQLKTINHGFSNLNSLY